MENSPILIDAIRAIKSDVGVSTRGDEIIWNDGNPTNITREEIDIKLAEMQTEYENALPLKLLREERDRLIAETDWRFRSDLTPSQAWKDYCKDLRDLPSTASPKVENGRLTNVTWPIKPE